MKINRYNDINDSKIIKELIKNSKAFTAQQNKYYMLLANKRHVAAMRTVLLDLSENDSIEFFRKLMQSKKDFALSVLDNINPRLKRFYKLFNSLEESTQQEYIQRAMKNSNITIMMGILISLFKENSTTLFTSLLKEDKTKKLAFSVLNSTYSNNRRRFRDLFNILEELTQEYIEHVIKNNCVTGMAGTFNELSEEDSTTLLKYLLKEDETKKLLAFSALNYIYNDSKKKFLVFLSVVHEEKYINYYISYLEKAETRLAQKILESNFLGESNHSLILEKAHNHDVHDDNHNVQNNQATSVSSSNERKSDDETFVKSEEDLSILKTPLTCNTSNNSFSVINKEPYISYNSNYSNAQSNQVVSPRKKQKHVDAFNIESSSPSGMLREPTICIARQRTLLRF